MNQIINIAKRKNIFVIEDCAEAIGSKINKKGLEHLAIVQLSAFMVTRPSRQVREEWLFLKIKIFSKKQKLLRDHGMSKNKRYWHEMVGFNYRMTNMQGAIGVAQMERFKEIIKLKQEIFSFITKN